MKTVVIKGEKGKYKQVAKHASVTVYEKINGSRRVLVLNQQVPYVTSTDMSKVWRW